jgi:sugar/nucleoside kinase (ribokinase family)
MARFLCVGNLLVENIVMPDGREAPGRLGGDAIYAVLGARAFADDVAPVVRLGRGFPDGLRRALEEAGYGDGLLPSDRPAVRLRVDLGIEGGSRFTFEDDSGTYLDATPLPDELPPGLDDRLEAVHVAPIPFERMEAWLGWARPRARILTLDPHYQHLEADWGSILPLVDAFLPSREEASGILGGWPGPEEAARALAELGAPMVCIKLGSEGALGRRGSELVRLLAANADPVDATGCGDAFCGGFLVGLTETGDLSRAMEQGTVAAGFAAAGHGAEHALAVDRGEAIGRLGGIPGT